MANKFKKAVEKRINDDETISNEIEKIEEENNIDIDINLSNILKKNERKAKNKTFYLDEDVIGGIAFAAKSQGVTESKLVNDVLKHILKIK